MKNLSVAQSYMLCALNENGKLPTLSNDTPACLMAASLIDLVLEQSVVVADKKVSTQGEISQKLEHLQSIYSFIKEKGSVKIEKLAGDYCFSCSDKNISRLIGDVGRSLEQLECASVKQGGIFGNRILFTPNKDAVDGVVQEIRAELLEQGPLSDEIVALAYLLEKSGMLKRYFSDYEKTDFKARIKELKQDPANKIIKDMLEYLDSMLIMVIIAAT